MRHATSRALARLITRDSPSRSLATGQIIHGAELAQQRTKENRSFITLRGSHGGAGHGRWEATNHTAAAGSHWAWGSFVSVDPSYYVTDAVVGKGADTLVKVLIPGLYYVVASTLSSGLTAGARADAHLFDVNTNREVRSTLDNDIGAATPDGYVKHKLVSYARLAANEGITVVNSTGLAYAVGWSFLQMRYVGA